MSSFSKNKWLAISVLSAFLDWALRVTAKNSIPFLWRHRGNSLANAAEDHYVFLTVTEKGSWECNVRIVAFPPLSATNSPSSGKFIPPLLGHVDSIENPHYAVYRISPWPLGTKAIWWSHLSAALPDPHRGGQWFPQHWDLEHQEILYSLPERLHKGRYQTMERSALSITSRNILNTSMSQWMVSTFICWISALTLIS